MIVQIIACSTGQFLNTLCDSFIEIYGTVTYPKPPQTVGEASINTTLYISKGTCGFSKKNKKSLSKDVTRGVYK